MIGRVSDVRVGLVGYGFVGKQIHRPLIEATPGFTLVAVASRDASKVKTELPEARVIADPMQMVTQDGIDLVVIASPNETHAPLATAALKAGKHVVSDKPFTLTCAEARDLAALAIQRERLLSVFHNRRWDSDFLGVRHVLNGHLLGRVTQFESHFDLFRPDVQTGWREETGIGTGLWFDVGPHLIDQMLQLFGLPDRLQANMTSQRTGAKAVDWAHVVLDYGRLRAILQCGSTAAGGFNRFVVHGEKGSLVKPKMDRQEQQLLAGMKPGAKGWGDDPDAMLFYDGSGSEQRIATPPGDQRRYYAGIGAALRDGAPNPVPASQASAVMCVLEAAVTSSETGRTVNLQFAPEELSAYDATKSVALR